MEISDVMRGPFVEMEPEFQGIQRHPERVGALERAAGQPIHDHPASPFGCAGIVIARDRSATVTPVVARTSAGAIEHARIAMVTNLARTLRQLHDANLEIVGLDAEATVPITELGAAPEGRVLVVGSEGHGLRRLVRESCTRVVRIEIPGPIASLNASVAAAIALHEASRARARPSASRS